MFKSAFFMLRNLFVNFLKEQQTMILFSNSFMQLLNIDNHPQPNHHYHHDIRLSNGLELLVINLKNRNNSPTQHFYNL
jgi:hypothetical protein